MTDIVERLRDLAAIDNCQASLEAAAEIERLRAALHRISLGSQDSGTTKKDLGREARAALKEDRT